MNMDRKLDLLAGEVADIKKEFRQISAGLRQLLDAQGQKPASAPGGPAAGEFQEHTTQSDDKVGLVGHPRGNNHVARNGGLVMSNKDLGQVLGILQAGAPLGPRSAAQTAPVSLEGLASAIKGLPDRVRSSAAQTDGHDSEFTMSLSKFAQMLKDPNVGNGAKTPRPSPNGQGQALPRRDLSQSRDIGRAAPPGSWVEHGSDERAAARSDASTRPVHSGEPSASSRRPRAGHAPLGRMGVKPATMEGADGEESSEGAKLDVNLVANLVRWVGSTKRALGDQGLRSLVETYALTGHLTPGYCKDDIKL